MPTNKKGKCLILSFCNINNKQEMLQLFKVEELEKSYEMGRWIGSVKFSVSPFGHTQPL